MKRRRNKGGKMGNLMKKAKELQDNLMKAQEEVKLIEVEGTAAGGMVKLILTGEKEIKSIKLNPDIVDPDDIELLEDSIVAAYNDANKKVNETQENKMGGLTGGFDLPNIF